MNFLCVLALLLAMQPSQPLGLYILSWASPLPVEVERITVTGGSIAQVWTSADGMSGQIAATAPRACMTIAAEGHTTTGAGVRFARSFDEACERLYLPLVVAPEETAHADQ